MKARVIATGEIIEISEDCSYVNAQHFEKVYYLDELEWIDIKKNNDIDYWTRLEHTYSGMAMQGLLSNPYIADEIDKEGIVTKPLFIAEMATAYAHALVKKMKEERK